MSSFNDKIEYAQETKRLLKNALIAKGAEVSEEDTFRSYVNKVTDLNVTSEIPPTAISINNFDATYFLNSGTTIRPRIITLLVNSNIDWTNFNNLHVTNMESMFSGVATRDNESIDVGNLDTSYATTFYELFANCSGLTSLDLNHFNVSNVQAFRYTFKGCRSLTSLLIDKWNPISATSFFYMFDGCSKLDNLNLSSWNTPNLTNTSYTFSGCASLKNLDISGWNMSKVTSTSYMFSGCSSLERLDLSNLDLSTVTDASYMFKSCKSLLYLDISNWDSTNLTNVSDLLVYDNLLETIIFPSNWLVNASVKSFNLSTLQHLSKESILNLAANIADKSNKSLYPSTNTVTLYMNTRNYFTSEEQDSLSNQFNSKGWSVSWSY